MCNLEKCMYVSTCQGATHGAMIKLSFLRVRKCKRKESHWKSNQALDESSDQGKCKKGKPWNPKNYSIGSAYFKRLRALDLLSILRIFLWQYLSMYTPVSKPNSYEHFDQIRIPIYKWHGSASNWFYSREYLTQMLLIEWESAREKESDFEREAV